MSGVAELIRCTRHTCRIGNLNEASRGLAKGGHGGVLHARRGAENSQFVPTLHSGQPHVSARNQSAQGLPEPIFEKNSPSRKKNFARRNTENHSCRLAVERNNAWRRNALAGSLAMIADGLLQVSARPILRRERCGRDALGTGWISTQQEPQMWNGSRGFEASFSLKSPASQEGSTVLQHALRRPGTAVIAST